MINKILEEREARYGDFRDHAVICQKLKVVMRESPSWANTTDSQKQALETIADKIARMLNGDPNYDDNWVDIIGYSQLVLNELHEGQTKMEFEEPEEGDVILAKDTDSGITEIYIRGKFVEAGSLAHVNWLDTIYAGG